MFTNQASLDHLLITLRVAAGLLLIGASAQILTGISGGPGLRGFARRAELFRVRAPMAFAVSAGLSMLLSGLAVVLEGFTSVAALTLVAFAMAATLFVRASEADGVTASFPEKLMYVVALLHWVFRRRT